MRKRTKMDGSVIHRSRPVLWIAYRRVVAVVSCAAVLIGGAPAPLRAQVPSAAEEADALAFSVEQFDALLAPVALYPDELLTQLLMASVYPLQVVDAARWIEDPANKALKDDALTRALAQKTWDPSVKSLVPFPQVLEMMNSKLDWMQQLGYAMAMQQSAVMDSVQRLRRQAQNAGQLRTTAQQVVRTEGQVVVIAPAQPNVVYVPTYNPTVVYGAWPYPSYPPVYLPPPPGYAVGAALATGLAFGAGTAIAGGLWGWARPNWGAGNVNVNVSRFNNINVNRPAISGSNWHPAGPANRPGSGFPPPTGPVGRPTRPSGLPANGIGRPNVSVPGGIVRPPAGMGPNNRPPIGQGGNNSLGGGQFAPGQGNRPGAGQGLASGNRPGGGQGFGQGNRPERAAIGQGGSGRAPGALSGIGDGRAATQFGNRGAQSRQSRAPDGGGGGARAGGGARLRAGAGGRGG